MEDTNVNEKDAIKRKVLDIVIEECDSADAPVTAEDVKGRKKTENVCMTRCILVTQLMFMGYSRTSIANFIGRSEQSISNILDAAHQYKIRSWAYRKTEAKTTLRIEGLMREMRE